MGDPTESEQLLRSKESADEFFDEQDADDELNYVGNEDEQADDQDREYDQQSRLCLSMGAAAVDPAEEEYEPAFDMDLGSAESSMSDDEDEPLGAIPSEGQAGGSEMGGLYQGSL